MTSPKKNRENNIMIRLNDDEFETVQSQAKQADLAVAVYVRQCATGKTITPKQNRKIYGKYLNQFAWIGNNLNQIAKAVNTAQAKDTLDELQLDEINARLTELQAELDILTDIIRQDQDR